MCTEIWPVYACGHPNPIRNTTLCKYKQHNDLLQELNIKGSDPRYMENNKRCKEVREVVEKRSEEFCSSCGVQRAAESLMGLGL
jgi:hypothetical protein